MAERVRFELTVALRQHRISSPAHSTTLPPLPVQFLPMLGAAMISKKSAYVNAFHNVRWCGAHLSLSERLLFAKIFIMKGHQKVSQDALPEYFRSVLWAHDFTRMNPEKDRQTIIVQAVNYGDLRHWRWIAKRYGKRVVASVLADTRADSVRSRVRSLASLLFRMNA